MNQIYLDHAATTPPLPEVCDTMISYMKSEWGNPSSLYDFSDEPRRAVLDARAHTAALIHADPKRIFFTSGGSESDSWALIGCARLLRCKGNHIIVSAIEHHAILHAAAFLEDEGFDITYLMPDAAGFIHPENLLKAMRPDTILVSIMMANNEIGTIQPISDLAYIAHTNGCEGCLFHTDAVQAVGHIPVDVHDLGIDMLSASAHKFNGPKGVGFLYIRNGLKVMPYSDGGAQEFGLRAGTENVAGIVGMAVALKNNCDTLEENTRYVARLESRFVSLLDSSGIKYVRNGGANRLPGLLSLSFPGADGEAVLHRLDLKGICISTGSACNSKNTEVSHVLQSIRLDDNYAKGTVRISLGKSNTEEDVETILKALMKIFHT